VLVSTASVNGISVGYDDAGDEAPLVGEFAGSGWRVIVPDLRGYGESSVVPGTVAWGTFAYDIAALLDHLQGDDIVLGGLSMGGRIVMEFSRVFPRADPRPAAR
jgi:3-oxoadipate enol-lactonase